MIRYAEEQGIGIIVYVNHLAMEKQIDELLPLYKKWGIKGIKFGFVNVGSQRWTRWLHDAIRKCAEHQFMVDVHDEYRPTGYSRTYPNLMTVEGIYGDETRPTNDQTLAYAFTRMLAGQADNTVCWNDPRVTQNSTYAYQLAKPVVLFSPVAIPVLVRPARGGRGHAGTGVLQPSADHLGRHAGPSRPDRRVRRGRPPQGRAVVHRLHERPGSRTHSTCRSTSWMRAGGYTAHVYSDDPAGDDPDSCQDRAAVPWIAARRSGDSAGSRRPGDLDRACGGAVIV